MDRQTVLLLALALLTVAGIVVGIAGVSVFRRSAGAAAVAADAAEDASTGGARTGDEPGERRPEPAEES